MRERRRLALTAMGTTNRQTARAINFNATALCLLLIVFAVCTTRAQETPAAPTPSPTPSATPTPTPAAVATPSPAATSAERPVLKTIKLNVQYVGKAPVVRKHFYVSRLPFNLDELQQKLGNLPSHKDYQKKASSAGLSEELVAEFIREWLEKYKCETVYCQPIALEDVQRIRVFQDAYKRASELFRNAPAPQSTELALKWMPNFLPQEIRTGYFDMKMDWTRRALALMEAETVGGEKNLIRTTMTDRRGEAYITDIVPGTTYYISNLIPIEDGKDCYLWNSKKEVKAGPGIEVGVLLGPNAKLKEIKGANANVLTFTCAQPE
jgi:hypothetical protein